jgi:hypothetical protein
MFGLSFKVQSSEVCDLKCPPRTTIVLILTKKNDLIAALLGLAAFAAGAFEGALVASLESFTGVDLSVVLRSVFLIIAFPRAAAVNFRAGGFFLQFPRAAAVNFRAGGVVYLIIRAIDKNYLLISL